MLVKVDAGGKNKGSSANFTKYMEKENKLKEKPSQEKWFGYRSDAINKETVQRSIDADRQGIKKNEGKYSTGSINLSNKEYQHLGATDQEREQNLKQWIKKDFTEQLAANYTKTNDKGEKVNIKPNDLKIFYKLERDRQYKGTDEEVKKGLARSGERKPGNQVHVHFIIAAKTTDKKHRVLPSTNNRKDFDRVKLYNNLEKDFDKKHQFKRELEETFEYKNTLKNGKAADKIQMIKQAVEQSKDKPTKDLTPLINEKQQIQERAEAKEKLREVFAETIQRPDIKEPKQFIEALEKQGVKVDIAQSKSGKINGYRVQLDEQLQHSFKVSEIGKDYTLNRLDKQFPTEKGIENNIEPIAAKQKNTTLDLEKPIENQFTKDNNKSIEERIEDKIKGLESDRDEKNKGKSKSMGI